MAASLLKPLLLNNGHTIPRLGVGTYLLTGDKCQEIVTQALELGYRHLDTAVSYTNEKDVGTAVGQCIKKGLVKRKDVFITTKIPPVYLAPKHVKYSIEESLENLQSDYLDLVLIHHPWGLKNKGDGDIRPVGPDGYYLDYQTYDLLATWSALEDSVQSGKVRSIGLSNYKESLLRDVLNSCTIRPQSLQLECHAYYQQNKLRQICDEFSITATAYSPIGAPGRPVRHYTDENRDLRLLEEPSVNEIAEKYNKTPAQVLIRFVLQQNIVAVPKTSSESRLKENLNVFDFEISADDMNSLRTLDRGVRFFTFLQFRKHPEFPKDDEPY